MTAHVLVLLRHAKAESPVGVADEQRPLSARGHGDARAAGVWLAEQHHPGLVLCSPSKRTRQTWHGVATSLADRGVTTAPHVQYEQRVYAGDENDLLVAVREVDETVPVVLVIGHNPTLSRLTFQLDPSADVDSDGLRTCGLAVFELPGPWADVSLGQARLTSTHTARGQ